MAGILSVLIFLIRYTFEMFVAHGLHEARLVLIALLDGSLSIWAIIEIALVARKQTPSIPLGDLTGALAAQLAVGVGRYAADYFALVPHAPGGASGHSVDFITLFVPIYAILFLLISKLLINAFSHTERLRANLLEVQMALNAQAQESLRQSEERYRLIADNTASDVIWTLDLAGRFTYVSPSVEKLRGYTPAEVMRQPMEEALTPASRDIVLEQFKGVMAAIQAGRPIEPFRGELEQPCKDGSTVWTEVTTNGIYDAEGACVGILGITRDIRERKRYEHELQRARDIAERANRAKSEFLAHMSHEIRTPMNAVLGLAQVLDRESLTPNQHDMVGRIQTAGRSLLAILNDILDFSKIEAGQLHIESRPFDLVGALVRVMELMEQTAQAKGLKLSITIPDEPVAPLLGDGLRLEQVLVNLLGNAVKFTARGEVKLSLQVLASSTSAVRLRFTVRDQGIGIAPEALARLFTPFTQAEAGISRRFGGTGLGLAICKRLVELMGGTIGAESQVGEGSTFWFELPFPRAAEGAEVAAPALPAPPPTGPRLTGLRVLVVDDSAMNRDVAERALMLEGAIVTLAADGRQAVELLTSRPTAFDALLMDVRMPVMDGLTATRLIRHELGLTDLPIIAFTAGVMTAEQQAARAAGANDVLAKPVDLERMTAVLLRWAPASRPSGGEGTQEGAAVGADEGAGVRLADPATSAPSPQSPPAVSESEEAPDDLPAIPGIDRVSAKRALGGDRAFFLRLLDRFLTEYADVVEQTRRDLAAGDRETAARRIHTLCGLAGSFGALELMATAGGLEAALRRGETDNAGEPMTDGSADLEADLAALGRQLAALARNSAPWRGASDLS